MTCNNEFPFHNLEVYKFVQIKFCNSADLSVLSQLECHNNKKNIFLGLLLNEHQHYPMSYQSKQVSLACYLYPVTNTLAHFVAA